MIVPDAKPSAYPKIKNGSFQHNMRESHARPLKGEKRKNLQKKAIRDKLTGGDIFKKKLNDDEVYMPADKFRNMSYVKNEKVFNTAISEARKEINDANHPILALKRMKETQKYSAMLDVEKDDRLAGVLQKIPGNPYVTMLYMKSGFKLYNKYGRHIHYRLYLDATGCFSNTKPNNKPLLQYTLFMNFPMNDLGRAMNELVAQGERTCVPSKFCLGASGVRR